MVAGSASHTFPEPVTFKSLYKLKEVDEQIDLPPKNCVILMEEKIIIECALMKLNDAHNK